MNKLIHISQILAYYDVPELFLGKDNIGTNYLCMLIEKDNDLKYLATLISINRLSQFTCGLIDLRSIYENPEIREFYLLDSVDGTSYMIEQSFDSEIQQDWLPLEGFLLNNPFNDDTLIVEESLERNNAVVHLAVSDEKDDLGIETDDLGDIIKLYSMLVENSYKKVISQRKLKGSKSYIIKENYKLRAFASSAASFNLHLFSEANKDLFGRSMIEFGLEKIDDIFESYDKDIDLLNVLRSIQGHGVSSFAKILKKISANNLKIKHKWFAPSRQHVNVRIIDKDQADRVLNIITSTIELSEEIKEFIGTFVQVDLLKKTWRLKLTDGGKEIFGTATEEQLIGLTIRTLEYRLICEEIIEEFKVSDKEKISYIFKSIYIID